jgi:diguanylate cyclase (GGDEF)-like protein
MRRRQGHGFPVAVLSPWCTALTAGTAVVAGYFLLPPGSLVQSLVYNAVGVAFGLCILAGVRLHRPARRALWYWFAAGQFTWVAGDVVWVIYEYALHQEPFPSPADVFYLATYPLLAVGLLLLVRDRRGRDVTGLIDAMIVATGLGLVFWVFVLYPVVVAAGASTLLEQVISTAYPAADVLLLVLVARLFTGSGGRTTSGRLLGLAALLLLVADVAFAVTVQHASYDAGDPVDALWLMSYVLWGVAALHPSMALPGARHAQVQPRVGRGRLALLTASSLLAPGMLFLPGITDRPADWFAAAAGAVVLFLLVALRMAGFVTQLQRQAGQLERLAMQDELTGLGNRRRLAADLRSAWRAGPRPSVVLLDLNGFKNVNDQLGHQAGDRLLVEVADRLAAAAGDATAVCRMGGDEFAVLLPGPDDAVLAVTGRILRDLQRPIRVSGNEVLIGATAGLARGPDATEPFEALRRADVALYAAKENGEPYRWYAAELDRLAGEEAWIGAELRTALQTGQFRLAYQPIVELPHGRMVAVEALIRWHHPERGPISPAEFIPVAERNGMIVEVGAWVLREACRQVARWDAECGTRAPQRISVNVSARQLVRPGLVAVVAAALADHGLPATRLTIEVTETAVFDSAAAAQTLGALRRMGVSIALDDFGTGHSSLTLLQTVPADVLKVDKFFIDEITAGGPRAVIPTALIEIADGLGMIAVAEGVETAEQAAELYRLGYRFGQGYHFGRPVEDLPAASAASAA